MTDFSLRPKRVYADAMPLNTMPARHMAVKGDALTNEPNMAFMANWLFNPYYMGWEHQERWRPMRHAAMHAAGVVAEQKQKSNAELRTREFDKENKAADHMCAGDSQGIQCDRETSIESAAAIREAIEECMMQHEDGEKLVLTSKWRDSQGVMGVGPSTARAEGLFHCRCRSCLLLDSRPDWVMEPYTVLGSYLLWEAMQQVVVPTVGKPTPALFTHEQDYPPIKDITRQWKNGKMPETNEYIPPRSGESCQHKHFHSGNMVLTSLPMRAGVKWKRIGCEGTPTKRCKCSFVRPERKTWKGDRLYCLFSNRRLQIRSGYEERTNRAEQLGDPIVRSGRKLWARKWTAVEPPTLYKDVSPRAITFERLYGDAIPNEYALRELHDWRDRLHKTGRWAVRSVDSLTSRKRKAYLRRHPIKLASTITYKLPLDKLEPFKIRPYK